MRASTTVIALALGISSIHCSSSSAINDCTSLAATYSTHLHDLCTPDGGAPAAAGPSRYCAICVVEAGLASYRVDSPGACVCQPLVLPVDQCASTIDDQSLLSGIRGADQECQTYQIPTATPDAGSDG
jgi:hypothetical protein